MIMSISDIKSHINTVKSLLISAGVEKVILHGSAFLENAEAKDVDVIVVVKNGKSTTKIRSDVSLLFKRFQKKYHPTVISATEFTRLKKAPYSIVAQATAPDKGIEIFPIPVPIT